MGFEDLEKVISVLTANIESREETEARVAAKYEARIAELEEENAQLTKGNKAPSPPPANPMPCSSEPANGPAAAEEAMLTRKAQDALESVGDDYDVSPILEQRIENLKINLKRVRSFSRKREHKYREIISELEILAIERLQDLIRQAKIDAAKNLKRQTQPPPIQVKAGVDDSSTVTSTSENNTTDDKEQNGLSAEDTEATSDANEA